MFAFPACGVPCAQRGGRLQRALPVFWSAYAVAAIASASWPVPERVVALANLASLCVLGLAIALAAPGPRAVVFIIAALFGASHGLANAGAIPPGANVLVALTGVVVAAVASSAWAYAAAVDRHRGADRRQLDRRDRPARARHDLEAPLRLIA
ncbi:MAG: HupE/UreJ family protein [Gammaproteobacteria bacterium]|nr:HupE/UreJ family protein [Gammaproteobacteria bacterium]